LLADPHPPEDQRERIKHNLEFSEAKT